jgi:hypothetical protein
MVFFICFLLFYVGGTAQVRKRRWVRLESWQVQLLGVGDASDIEDVASFQNDRDVHHLPSTVVAAPSLSSMAYNTLFA